MFVAMQVSPETSVKEVHGSVPGER